MNQFCDWVNPTETELLDLYLTGSFHLLVCRSHRAERTAAIRANPEDRGTGEVIRSVALEEEATVHRIAPPIG
jgi:hypothetical protein